MNNELDTTQLNRPEKKTMQRDRTHILASMPVGKAIWTLALPTMAAMLVQVIYNMTDTFFIGKLNDPHMVAAVAISMPIFFVIQSFGNIFAIGGASLISRLLGKGERESASQTGAISFWSALAVCVAVAVTFLILREPILMACGASENTIGFGKSYLGIMLLGSPFIGLQMTLGGLLRSEGATREAMTGMMTGSILNIILDPIFILLLGLGVAGAALATSIGNMVGFSYYLYFYLKKKGIVSIAFKHYSFNSKIYAEIFKIGIPASLGLILMSVGFSVANVFAASFGDDVVAANGVVMRITSIDVMLTLGLAQGCQPLLGYSYGSKNYQRLLETIKRAITIGTAMGIFFVVLFYFFADLWIQIFINDAAVIELGAKIIRAFVLGMPFLGTQMVLMTTFQSLGRAVESLIVSLGRQGLFFIPALVIFCTLWGFSGFIFALPVADIATSLLSLTLFLLLRKRLLIPPGGVPEAASSEA